MDSRLICGLSWETQKLLKVYYTVVKIKMIDKRWARSEDRLPHDSQNLQSVGWRNQDIWLIQSLYNYFSRGLSWTWKRECGKRRLFYKAMLSGYDPDAKFKLSCVPNANIQTNRALNANMCCTLTLLTKRSVWSKCRPYILGASPGGDSIFTHTSMPLRASVSGLWLASMPVTTPTSKNYKTKTSLN